MTSEAGAAPARLTAGDQFPALELTGITGETVAIPDSASRLTHLQFRRFAGCPICDLHLRSIRSRLDEIKAAGVREVVVFHSTAEELHKYQDDLPFPVIGDPDMELYRRFGVEASVKSVLVPRVWGAAAAGWRHAISDAVTKRRAPSPASPTNGRWGLPADMLIDAAGRVAAVKYGTDAYDQWSVDELLAIAEGVTSGQNPPS